MVGASFFYADVLTYVRTRGIIDSTKGKEHKKDEYKNIF